ncbi:F0F1 ATP synthase subunit gamma [Thiomonas sp. FB-6]|uniref:F0F1 ATP synthase subunit gamma n=1 Tax=Thiomonas sp. FB-6 TaxID=1158291 RepID=UPI00037BAE4F|nr:F0F1 ATP synthase subunit gamma [Thiomonas sp. FB-6]
MSDSTASLRRKVASAGELHSVVRTMKALAASSITQYENSVAALADYARTVELGLGACLRQGGMTAHADGATREPAPGDIRAVVFGSDQGLVGRFNEIVVEHAIAALSALPGTPRVWAVGERAHARLADAGVQLVELYAVPNGVQAITPLVGKILVAQEVGTQPAQAPELHLYYNRPSAAGAYAPVSLRLLPLDGSWTRALAGGRWPTALLPEVIGLSGATLRALIREYLFVSLFRACAESLASENASRLAAMERADRNIDELLQILQGAFHRLRQSGIDEELFDVVSGFEALTVPSRRPKEAT